MMNRKGFTLIELMIVIAIIGILAAMAMPNFKTSRWQARQKACYSNIRVIQGAVEMYNMDSPTMIGTGFNSDTVLVSGGYLKPGVKCPEMNSWTYKDNGKALDNDGEVCCGVSGTGGTLSDMGKNHGSLSGF